MTNKIIKHDKCIDVAFVIKNINLIKNKQVNIDGYWIYLKTKRVIIEDNISIPIKDIELWKEVS